MFLSSIFADMFHFYFAINHKITGICSKYGADYYDFNLVKPDLFSICSSHSNTFVILFPLFSIYYHIPEDRMLQYL